MSPGSPLLPSQTDPVSLKWIMGPSQTALLQFSFSRLFYICLLLCAWALADAQLCSGCNTASQTGCQSLCNDALNESCCILTSCKLNMMCGLLLQFWENEYHFQGFHLQRLYSSWYCQNMLKQNKIYFSGLKKFCKNVYLSHQFIYLVVKNVINVFVSFLQPRLQNVIKDQETSKYSHLRS